MTKHQWAGTLFLAFETTILLIWATYWATGGADLRQAVRGFTIGTLGLLLGICAGYALAKIQNRWDRRPSDSWWRR